MYCAASLGCCRNLLSRSFKPSLRRKSVSILPYTQSTRGLSTHSPFPQQPSKEFYERFYDTRSFELLNQKCWLRSRTFIEKSRETEWVFQEQSKNLGDGLHFYQEYRGTEEVTVRQRISNSSQDTGM